VIFSAAGSAFGAQDLGFSLAIMTKYIALR